ncbi:MAG: beta strand repeat-containing protein, partial [Roseiarcus sp.]
MAADIWNGTGNWNTNTSDWSLGAAPGSSDDAVVQSGTVTLTAAGAANVITVASDTELNVSTGGTLTAKGVTNIGTFDVGTAGGSGGESVTISGSLANSGSFTLGNSSLSTTTTVTVGSLADTGTVTLWGNETLGTTDQATLDVLGAAPTTLTGSIYLHGDADLEYGSGGIKRIAAGAEIQFDGQQSRVSIGAGTTNSALDDLATNYGTLDLEGDWVTGPGGTTVDLSHGLTNDGTLELDVYYGDGASRMSIAGTLTNSGAVTIGNTGLSAPSTLTVGNFSNSGTITLSGNDKLGTSDQATLIDQSAAPSIITGSIYLQGDADLEFASGGIMRVGHGATLGIDGQQARLSIGAGTTNSALSGFVTNNGTFEEEDGAVVSTLQAFTNAGTADIDSDSYGEGGTIVMFGGAFTNEGALNIGNTGLSAATTVKATSLSNTGSVVVQGNTGGATTPVATLAISG